MAAVASSDLLKAAIWHFPVGSLNFFPDFRQQKPLSRKKRAPRIPFVPEQKALQQIPNDFKTKSSKAP